MNYKDTVLTPKTEFPMRAGLVQKEPVIQKDWADKDLYRRIREARAGKPRWILHDGPPYANGDIHMGHVLNKVLKDMVVKVKTMQDLDSPYVPGWDCHGLPIEHKVMTDLKSKLHDLSPSQIRAECRKNAERYIKLQSQQFQRLGVLGDFDRPYVTMDPGYEAEVIKVFADLVEQNLVYRQLKPVHWCVDCRTALAEAELEYQDREDTSIFVNFEVSPQSRPRLGDVDTDAVLSLMIWTTTPWTLPANMAIAVHPDFTYQLVAYERDGKKHVSVIAKELVEYVMQSSKLAEFQRLHTISGSELSELTYQHAFIDRECPVVLADYVTLEDEKGNPTGTGLVHTAPGHGAEDYFTGQTNNIEIYSPVLADGTFDDTVPDWIRGVSVWKGNELICDHLVKTGHMFHQNRFVHSYPHCWRSRTPTVFRCTEQWFVKVSEQLPATAQSLRDMALAAVQDVTWVPGWGQSRIEGMLLSRPDWCLSRQRVWGLPIPAFYGPDGRTVLTPEIARAVAEHFCKHGSDSWFTDTPSQILGACPLPDGLAAGQLSKEQDIFDVWFESGSSWAAVCRTAGWDLPIEMYLEGSDQHRGWFQLSLLPALGSIHEAPFKIVLTHGFIVDELGKKMSKSAGNVVDPQKELSKYGADVMRLWVASVDYQNDVRCSDNLIKKLSDEYRKVRNTIRFLLGAIYDFDPANDTVTIDEKSIDAWARMRLNTLIRNVTRLYNEFAFYKVFKQIHDFCNIDMSQIYFVALKDRLYCDPADSTRRRRSQTTLREIADSLIRLIAPILVHTAEEAFAHLTAPAEPVDSVHLAHLPEFDERCMIPQVEQDWEFILELREDAMMQLERLKREHGMTNPLDAQAVYHVSTGQATMLSAYDEEPGDVLGVGSYRVEVTAGDPHVVIEDVREKFSKCARSWKRRADVGSDAQFPDLSARDAEVMRQLVSP